LARLTPPAEELVRAGRAAFQPSDADRERVFQALLPHTGGAEGAGTEGLAPAGAVAKASLAKISAVVVALGVAGGGLYLATRPAPSPTKAPVSMPAKAAPVQPAPNDDAPASVPATPEPPSVEKRAPAAVRSADNLAQEVAILSRAGAELHAGRPAAALTALDDHQRKFPSGVLVQERSAARVQALCALGRTKEARTAFERLARTSPSSPHVVRARKACGF
jgi:hypothetical protein